MCEGNSGATRAMRGTRWGIGTLRAMTLAMASAVTIGLVGCGGGVELHGVGFSVGVAIDGRPYGGPVESGAQRDVSIYAGHSIEFDGSEPVVWTLHAGNAVIPADGSTVLYGGASIRVSTVSSSRIVVDTAASGPLLQAVPITLTATSTWDSALVATIDVTIF